MWWPAYSRSFSSDCLELGTSKLEPAHLLTKSSLHALAPLPQEIHPFLSFLLAVPPPGAFCVYLFCSPCMPEMYGRASGRAGCVRWEDKEGHPLVRALHVAAPSFKRLNCSRIRYAIGISDCLGLVLWALQECSKGLANKGMGG